MGTMAVAVNTADVVGGYTVVVSGKLYGVNWVGVDCDGSVKSASVEVAVVDNGRVVIVVSCVHIRPPAVGKRFAESAHC